MTLHATGWAVASDGMIDTRTVRSTRRQAIMEWLLFDRDVLTRNEDSDFKIEALWEHHGAEAGARAIEVDICWRPS